MRLLALVLALLAAAPAALAEPSPASRERAKKYFDRGQKLYSVGRFDEALVQYEKAYDEAELPELLFNIAQCHRNLEHYDLAIFTFRKYLREKPDATNHQAVEKLIDELEEARGKAPPARPPPRLSPVPGPTHPTGPDLTGTGRTEEPAPARPIYKRWWFWTGIAAVAGGVAAGVILIPGGGGIPDSTLGNIDISQ